MKNAPTVPTKTLVKKVPLNKIQVVEYDHPLDDETTDQQIAADENTALQVVPSLSDISENDNKAVSSTDASSLLSAYSNFYITMWQQAATLQQSILHNLGQFYKV